MRNGLYKIEFQTPRGAGGGVVVLMDGIIRGGDSALYYIGNYKVEGGQFTATVQTARHFGTPQTQPSVFGIDKISINAQGQAGDDRAKIVATSPQAPGIRLDGALTRIGD
jgi:hypothetical protein